MWAAFGVNGRVYIAAEGINAQLTIPPARLDALRADIASRAFGANIFLNLGESLSAGDPALFRALHVRIKPKIVAEDVLDEAACPLDLTKSEYLSPLDWNHALEHRPLVFDCRNWYESDIGRFEGARQLRAATYDRMFPELKEQLVDTPKDEPVMIYCTGGIRCEKISAYMRQHLGFTNVKQLRGGVVNYARSIREAEGAAVAPLVSKFRGTQFSFDARVTRDIPASRLSPESLA